MLKRLVLTLIMAFIAFGVEGAVPHKMAAPTVTALAYNQLSVSWSVPNNGGALISHYLIKYKESALSNWTDKRVNGQLTTSTTLDNLKHHTSYDVKIQARNNQGPSPFSDTVTAKTLKGRTYIEYRNEDGNIQEFDSMGKNPPYQPIALTIDTLQRDNRWGIDVRQFVEPFGRDLRVKCVNGDEIAKVGTKFYLRMMTRAEFDRLGWGAATATGGSTIEQQWNGHRRQEKHPFFWTLREGGQSKGHTWNWVEKPTEAWFRVSVSFDKCKCGIQAPMDFHNFKTPGVDGAMYFMVLQVKVKRPGKSHNIDNRIPLAMSVSGTNGPGAPAAIRQSPENSLATSWGAMKSGR